MKIPSKPTILALAIILATPLAANPARDAIINALKQQAGVSSFSAEEGKALFLATHSGGKPETPSCTTCHGTNLKAGGKTRAGKPIEPMAVSVNPQRYTDPAKVEKWFRRNCNSVLGRECTPLEKGNILAYLSSL